MVFAKVESGLEYLKNKPRFLARTFIIPTGFGISFGGISFVLLIMAIGYANNLLYFFVFLLISMALTGMWMTNKNIESVSVVSMTVQNIFANQDNSIEVQLQNNNAKNFLWNIELAFDQKKKKAEITMVDEVRILKTATLQWRPAKRGLQDEPRLLIQSRFPYQMLRAWKYYDKKTKVLVYPEKKGSELIPTVSGNASENEVKAQLESQGLFRDHREFQKSDSPRRIDWRQSSKHQKHLVKNFESGGEKKVLLDWDLISPVMGFEDRLSQMCLWIDICQKRQEAYSLKIKEDQTEYSCLQPHYKSCLEKLALLRIEDVT